MTDHPARAAIAEGSDPAVIDMVELVAAAGRVIDLWLDGTITTPMYSPANAALLALRRSLGDQWRERCYLCGDVIGTTGRPCAVHNPSEADRD